MGNFCKILSKLQTHPHIFAFCSREGCRNNACVHVRDRLSRFFLALGEGIYIGGLSWNISILLRVKDVCFHTVNALTSPYKHMLTCVIDSKSSKRSLTSFASQVETLKMSSLEWIYNNSLIEGVVANLHKKKNSLKWTNQKNETKKVSPLLF